MPVRDLVLFLARLILAVTFALSGTMKLVAPLRTRDGLLEFGISARVVTPMAIALVAAEIAVPILILVPTTAFAGGGLAIVLLTVFSVAVAVNLAYGRRPACNCFGQLHSAPIGWPMLGRNAALMVIAVFATMNREVPTIVGMMRWLEALTFTPRVVLAEMTAGIALSSAVVMLLFQVLSQQGRILLRLDQLDKRFEIFPSNQNTHTVPQQGVPIGLPAPSFELQHLEGGRTGLADLLKPSLPVILVFSNPNCGPCQQLMPEISRWQHEYSSKVTIALISEGKAKENRAKAAQHRLKLKLVMVQRSREVAEQYQSYGTPSAVMIDANGTIGSFLAPGADAIQMLVSQVVALHRALLKVGEAAPPLVFKGMDGREISLSAFHGTELILLFWNPSCSFCQRMLNNLRSWESYQLRTAVRLIVISTGAVEENREQNLRSLIVIDQEFVGGAAFGVSGTPTALRLDREGKIASQLVVGGDEVMALIYESGKNTHHPSVKTHRLEQSA